MAVKFARLVLVGTDPECISINHTCQHLTTYASLHAASLLNVSLRIGKIRAPVETAYRLRLWILEPPARVPRFFTASSGRVYIIRVILLE